MNQALNFLTNVNAVFLIETDEDRIYIGTAWQISVQNAVHNLIKKVASPNYTGNLELKKALFQNAEFKIEIIADNILSEKELYEKKYEAIYYRKSYEPLHGYNTFGEARKRIEKEAARPYIQRIHDELVLTYGEPEIKRPIRHSKKVCCYNKSGQLLKEYPSSAEAAKETGIPQSNIWRCCAGKLKSAHGVIWKYANT